MTSVRIRHRELPLFSCIVLVALLLACDIADQPAVHGASQRRTSRTRVQKKVSPAKPPGVDYAQFSHRTHVDKQKLACDSCHRMPSKNWKEVRQGDEAFADVTDFPEHSSCLNCHRKQFFTRERPAPVICSNCHIKSSPRDNSRYLFPSLGDVTDPTRQKREFISEFGVAFPHDKHVDVVGFNRLDQRRDLGVRLITATFQERKEGMPKSCPVCHQTYQPQDNSSEEYFTKPPKNIGDSFWLKKGTFKTIPNSHAVCFTCHNSDSGITPEPKDCNVCHKLLTPEANIKFDFNSKLANEMGADIVILASWSRRMSAGAFRHEGGEHPNLSCTSCHDVVTLNTDDRKTRKVAVKSCGGAEGCHITPTADDGGALNFEFDQKKKDPAFVCTKCHIEFGREAIPLGHAQAIPTPAPKKPG